MKKLAYLISCIALLVGVVLTVQSCIKTEENKQDTAIETEADKFVASPEYQGYLEKYQMESFNITLLLIQLSDEQYREFMDLNKKVLATKNRNERIALSEAMSNIISYDLRENNRKKAIEYRELLDGKEFSSEDLLRAQAKYTYRYVTEVKPLTRGKKESERQAMREARRACKASCNEKHIDESNRCFGSDLSWEQVQDCLDYAQNRLFQCIEECNSHYRM